MYEVPFNRSMLGGWSSRSFMNCIDLYRPVSKPEAVLSVLPFLLTNSRTTRQAFSWNIWRHQIGHIDIHTHDSSAPWTSDPARSEWRRSTRLWSATTKWHWIQTGHWAVPKNWGESVTPNKRGWVFHEENYGTRWFQHVSTWFQSHLLECFLSNDDHPQKPSLFSPRLKNRRLALRFQVHGPHVLPTATSWKAMPSGPRPRGVRCAPHQNHRRDPSQWHHPGRRWWLFLGRNPVSYINSSKDVRL